MRAKDTVKSYGTLRNNCIKAGLEPNEINLRFTQAEISFKAGYEQRKNEVEMTTISLAEMCLKHRKAGIKEAVKFANNFAGIKHNPEWIAKQKEWKER